MATSVTLKVSSFVPVERFSSIIEKHLVERHLLQTRAEMCSVTKNDNILDFFHVYDAYNLIHFVEQTYTITFAVTYSYN